MITDPQTAMGRQLYALLPEVYRSRDNGDLAGLLDGLGHVLGLVRSTLEQRLADSFPDEPLSGRACQPWLLPYFAELVDARLVSPDPSGQRAEVANAIGWRQVKGTLANVEQVAQDVGRFEVEVQEGWKRVAVTPRTGWSLPSRATGKPGADPFAVDRPLGTVAFGLHARAVQPKSKDDPAAHRFLNRDILWRQANPHGTPCFPGSYEDPSARTVDLRSPDWRKGHHHPRRLLLYFPPPAGFFQPGAVAINWTDWDTASQELDARIADLKAAGVDLLPISGGRVIERLKEGNLPVLYRIRKNDDVLAERTTEPDGTVLTRLLLKNQWLEERLDSGLRELRSLGDVVQIQGNVSLAGAKTWVFENLAFLGKIDVAQGRLVLRGAAVNRVSAAGNDLEEPVVDAVGSLFGELGTAGLARLEYVTVLGTLAAGRLQASDSILGGAVTVPKPSDPELDHCVRYSRIDASTANVVTRYCTSSKPLYVELDFDDGRRPAHFGEPGCGVLHPACPRAIRSGAEDGGEMGAFHDRRYSLALDAVSAKLQDFLPLGLDAVLIPDPRLHGVPPALKT
ncbi:MAG TPA: phage tail protein [Thermoanaerobaculia bacterium]|nr:phage tail protein [Thermoanaerobaculia bacterium]